MNQEKQRIAIAEACGKGRYEPIVHELPFVKWKRDGVACAAPPPDYLNSLDAMHEAVETLRYRDGFEWFDFQKHLLDICGSVMNCIQATAEQRAEALLKTLRLWTEEE